MNDLIKIKNQNIGGEDVNSVDARELHEFLEVGRVFTAWINSRIEKYDFVENQDFVCFPVLESKSQGRGGHNRIEYILTIDMAKELSMIERNDKGREARKYFIACEKKLKSNGLLKIRFDKQSKERTIKRKLKIV